MIMCTSRTTASLHSTAFLVGHLDYPFFFCDRDFCSHDVVLIYRGAEDRFHLRLDEGRVHV